MKKKPLLPHAYVPCTCGIFDRRPHCGAIGDDGFACSLSPGHQIHAVTDEVPTKKAEGIAA